MKKAVVFDLDGTLWDSRVSVSRSWSEYIAQNCPDVDVKVTEQVVNDFQGLDEKRIADRTFPKLDEQRRIDVTHSCLLNDLKYIRKHGAREYDGMRSTLIALSRDYDIFVVSNCVDGYIEVFLECCKLKSIVRGFECAGRTGLPKSQNISLVLRDAGIAKKDAVYVGDTEWDAAAAASAGVRFVFASYGFGNVQGAEREIGSLTELPALLAEMFGEK